MWGRKKKNVVYVQYVPRMSLRRRIDIAGKIALLIVFLIVSLILLFGSQH